LHRLLEITGITAKETVGGFAWPAPTRWFGLDDSAEQSITCGRAFVAKGTVKWFNPTKGYGFIQPEGGGKDVFVHISAVERAGLSTLNEGVVIEFEVVANRGKESAENIKVR
jgi:CspA family cold shock protein